MHTLIGISGRNGYIVHALPNYTIGNVWAERKYIADLIRGLRKVPGMGRKFSWFVR